MPNPVQYKEDVCFEFTVTTGSDPYRGGFASFMNDVAAASIKLRSVAGFVVGRKTKLFCVADNAKLFRTMAKERGLRVRQKKVLIYTADVRGAARLTILPLLNAEFLTVALHEILPAFSFSSRGEAFMYQDKPA